MKTKEIILQNILNMDYMPGKSIKGKGLEILDPSYKTVVSFWKNSDNEKDFLKKISKYNLDDLFVSSISLESKAYYEFANDKGYEDYKKNLDKYDLKKIVSKGLKGVECLYIKKRPTFIGYISLSKYTSDLASQQELVEDLLALEGKELYGDFDRELYYEEYDDDVMFFEKDTNGSYSLFCGNSLIEDKDSCLYFDGRLSSYNDFEVNDFWSYEVDEIREYIKDVNKDENVSVFHRKGKDWYIGYSLDEAEVELLWKDEEIDYRKENYDFESITFTYLTYKEDKETIKEVVSILKSSKEDIEKRSFISNELNLYEESNNHPSSIFDLWLLDLIFNDRYEAKNYIFDEINWESDDIQNECIKANNKLIAKHVKFNIDYSIEVEELQYFSDKKPIIEKYNQLKIVKRLESRFGYKLVYSKIGNSNEYGFAIKQGDEEYHFYMSDLFDPEDSYTPIELIEHALSAINLRKIKNLSDKELREKASRVFVSIADSLKAGNCHIGTMEFCNRNDIDATKIGAIRGDYLLELENDNFTKRVIAQKLAQLETAC